MKDLKKMRENFEKEYARQEIANKLEEQFGIEFYISDSYRSKGMRIVAHGDFLVSYIIPRNVARKLLDAYPADTEILLNNSASGPKEPVYGMYHVTTHRGFSEKFTTLKVRWLCHDNEYEFCLKIDGDETLEQFFVDSTRKMDSCERETYKPVRRGHIVKDMDIPIKKFKCSQLCYAGGHVSCTDTGVIGEIVKSI